MNIAELEECLKITDKQAKLSDKLIKEWIATRSTAISHYGYNAQKRVLGVRFRSNEGGYIYYYLNVNQHHWDAFLKSKSKGKYLNTSMRWFGYKTENDLTARDLEEGTIPF